MQKAISKIILLAAATLFALSAGAQNKSIDALADKYTDGEGFTIVNLEGDAIKSMSSMISDGDGTINLGDGETHKISELLEEIVSVTAIILRGVNETFSSEVQNALDAVKYNPIMSHNESGQRIKIESTDIRRGKLRGNKEIVMLVDGEGQTVLLRVIGKIDTDLLSKLVANAAKK